MSGRTWQIIFLFLVFLLLFYVAYILRAIFIPVMVALILAYILNPLVTWLEVEKKVPRLVSIGGIYALFLIVFLSLIFIAIPAAVMQGVEFVKVTFIGVEADPDAGTEAQEAKINNVLKLGGDRLEKATGLKMEQLVEKLKTQLTEHAGDVTKFTGKLAAGLGSWVASGIGLIFAFFSFVVLIPVYLFFFLRGMNKGWARLKEWLPPAYRDRILETLGKMHKANASFFRGQLTICLIEGAIVFVVLLLTGVKFSFLWGILYATLALIPFIGPVSAFSTIAVFVLADTGQFGTQFYVVVGVFVLIQALEGIVLQPMILGKETGLHPVAIIMSLLIFGQLFGFFGMLLAVPLYSAAQILIKDYVLPVLKEVTDEKKISFRRS